MGWMVRGCSSGQRLGASALDLHEPQRGVLGRQLAKDGVHVHARLAPRRAEVDHARGLGECGLRLGRRRWCADWRHVWAVRGRELLRAETSARANAIPKGASLQRHPLI